MFRIEVVGVDPVQQGGARAGVDLGAVVLRADFQIVEAEPGDLELDLIPAGVEIVALSRQPVVSDAAAGSTPATIRRAPICRAPRAARPEWATVGLTGKLRLRRGQPVDPRWIRMREVCPGVEEWLLR